jgi:hypothetical protein
MGVVQLEGGEQHNHYDQQTHLDERRKQSLLLSQAWLGAAP